MIFEINKTSTDGRVFTHHQVVSPSVDMSSFNVTAIVRSWQNEDDAANNSENYVEFYVVISHGDYQPSYLDDLETQVLPLIWQPYKNQYAPLAPVFNLAEAKVEKRKLINTTRDTLEKSGFTYMGKVIDSDITSVIRISIAVQGAQTALAASVPFEVVWTAKDNSTLTLDASQLIGMSIALSSYANDLHVHAREKKTLIDAATTQAELEAVQW